MPKHRKESSTFEKASQIVIVGGLATSLALAASYAEKRHLQSVTACTVVPNYPEQLPREDINVSTIQRVLKISAGQLNLVRAYAATCRTPLDNAEFSQGITRNARDYNELFNTTYDRCAIYGVAKQLVPSAGDETSPAVLVCVDLPPPPKNLVQI